jgi:WD40 repeat protein
MDHKVFIYHRESFRLKGTCDRHNSYIKNFDFSADGSYIQSDSGDYEHLFFEAEDGKHFPQGSQLNDVSWTEWTCTFGWPVQGCWPKTTDLPKDVNATDADALRKLKSFSAHEPASLHRSPDEKNLAVGCRDGTFKIYNYPCVSKEVSRIL